MNNLINFLERHTNRKIDRELLQAFISNQDIDVNLIYFTFTTANETARELLLDIYKKRNIWEVL